VLQHERSKEYPATPEEPVYIEGNAVKVLKFKEFQENLREIGIEKGNTVHVQSDLRRIGPVDCAPNRESILEFYLAGFQDVIGETGTITVNTGFGDYARFGTPFVRETSPSHGGVFSEYIRTRSGAVRSMHPVISVTALGYRAQEICGGPHFVGLGWDSPWGRLHRLNAKMLSLGLGPYHVGGMTFFHYVEKMYGIPYQYNKIFSTPVYSGGTEVKGPFFMSVRYLDYNILYDSTKLRLHLLDKGILRLEKIGHGMMTCGTSQQIFDETIKCFRDNPYIMLKSPPAFRQGEIPMDGNTGPRVLKDGRADSENESKG